MLKLRVAAVFLAISGLALGREAGSALPKVHLLGTGGTISGGRERSLTAKDLAELIPDLDQVAEVSVEDYSSIGSSRMTPELQFRLASRVRAVFDERPDLSGIVVTHGTDSLEETAFLLDLLVPAGRPVVFTAAQRPPREVDTDGPRNLGNAVRIAASADMPGLGVLVTLNDEIHAARDVRKTHSVAVNAFASLSQGPIGQVDSGRLYLYARPVRRLTLAAEQIEPRVELVTLYPGSDGSQIAAAVDSGKRGIVVEVFGRGNAPPGVMEAVTKAREKGVVVVFTTRTGGGRVELSEGAARAGVISGEDVDGLKARVLLTVALGAGADLDALREYFRRLSGELPLSRETN